MLAIDLVECSCPMLLIVVPVLVLLRLCLALLSLDRRPERVLVIAYTNLSVYLLCQAYFRLHL